MIIDLHTHIWASLDQLGPELAARLRRRSAEGVESLDASPAAHERAMGPVDGAVVLGFRADRMGARIPNEFIAGFVARDPGRRVGIAGVDPMADDVSEQIEQAVALGLVGVCVSPACQGFHPSHSRAMRVYERCEELSLPVFVTLEEPLSRTAELEFARPTGWDEVARDLPGLRLVICGLGYPHIDETLLLVGKHQRVYADISGIASRRWQLYNALLSASSHHVMDKLLFGSGFPHDTPARTIEALYTLNAFGQGTPLPSIARSSIKAIIEKNSLACLGIETEVASGHAAVEHALRNGAETATSQREEEDLPVVDVVGQTGEPLGTAAPGPGERPVSR
jgi:predicted TIM-barrel fold metal-dependent hydrolase